MTADSLDPTTIAWQPAEAAPLRYMVALVKLKDGTITVGIRQQYYLWHWSIAIPSRGYSNQGDGWSSRSGDDVVAFSPMSDLQNGR